MIEVIEPANAEVMAEVPRAGAEARRFGHTSSASSGMSYSMESCFQSQVPESSSAPGDCRTRECRPWE